MSPIEFLVLLSNAMFALYRWIDIRENRKNREVARETQRLQREYNDRVAKILDELTPKG